MRSARAMFMRMKIRISSLIVVLPVAALLLPPVVIALDNPHKNGITCGICHKMPSSTWWTDQGATNGLCGQCHYPGSANGDAVIHSITPTYGNIVMPCTQCHNPHYQKQLRTWKAAGYLATGTIGSVTTTTLTRTGTTPGWSKDQWKGMLLIPDVRYLQYNYRIASNTASVITIDTSRGDAILLAYAAPGASFAIAYGGLVKESLGGYSVKFLRDTGVNSFADGDATWDGVCEVCHTRTTHFRRSGAAPDQLHTSIGSSAAGTRCVVCHKHTGGFTGTNAGCLGCHDGPVGGRAAVGSRFQASSHHVQGVEVTNQHCYQCHWEANDDGTINSTYHSGSSTPGSAVDLVIYGAAVRPTSYTINTTAIQYLANGSRPEINKLTTHCLGCHSDQNNATQPFAPGDTRTPKQYAWDGSSVANRYSQAGVVPWGKYSGAGITPKNTVQKAYSAHGNAIGNQGGWDLNETWPNTRNGSVNVQCFDCHNSHGSGAAGRTSSYSSATASGGILKETSANQGGYSVTYTPAAGGSTDTKNAYNAGASLCFDCHQTQMEGVATPWGYGSTFGESLNILGYWDSPYFGPGTFGSQQRYTYKASGHKGGHFGASAPVPGATGTIDGLCTPCHDPHGVTNNTAKIAAADKPYAVPLLKGTWLTSPYQEDRAPAINTTGTIDNANAGDVYHIDQNTFGAHLMDTVGGITQTDAQFGGLCLTCHPKNSLTDGANGGTWKSVDRIHESVKGWGANAKHKYSCSKCHTPHNSRLPRLMVSNCLNTRHKGRLANNSSPVLSGSGYACDQYIIGDYRGCGGGSGGFPGTHGGDAHTPYTVSCHENKAADQSWNVKTSWGAPTVPVFIDEPDTICSTCSVMLQWNASTNPEGNPIEYSVQVDDVSDFSSPNYASGWISGTSWTASIATNTKWYWRIRARDSVQTSLLSTWSTADSFILSDGAAPPAPTLSSPANGWAAWTACDTLGYWMTFSYFSEPLTEYRVRVDDDPAFVSVNYDSGWTTSTTWGADISSNWGTAVYYWKVGARNILDPGTENWSGNWSFTIYYGGGCPIPSCPFVFAWDGQKYAYVTDLQGQPIGYAAGTYLSQWPPYFRPQYVTLGSLKPDAQGKYTIKLREPLPEISYLDEAKLLEVEYPAGYELASSTSEMTYRFNYANPFKLYTLRDPRPPVSAVDQDGADVLAAVGETDGNLLPMQLFALNSYLLDFGPIDPANAKLVIDGWSVFGSSYSTPLPTVQPFIEVLDAGGQWVKVKSFGEPAGDLKRMVIDLSGLFPSSDRRIRLNTGRDSGMAWRIDRIAIDDSAPVPVTIHEISAGSADLHYRGRAPYVSSTLEHRITAWDDVMADDPASYGFGSFTKYGDVQALLTATDDKFAIMRHGDEISLVFTGSAATVPAGMQRSFVLKTDVYYKTFRVNKNVEPLPFHGMSMYPYDPAVEHYPNDAEHQQYLLEYNTRVH